MGMSVGGVHYSKGSDGDFGGKTRSPLLRQSVFLMFSLRRAGSRAIQRVTG